MSTMLKNSRWVLLLCCALTLLLQLYLCFFFNEGDLLPSRGDHNPATIFKWRFDFPPEGFFSRDYWLGNGNLPVGLDPLSLMAWLPTHFFFSCSFGVWAVALILGVYRLCREVGLRREVAALAGLFLAWQGDYLGFVRPGHYGNAPQWALVPWMFWLALRAIRSEPDRAGFLGLSWRSWYAAALCGGAAGAIVSLAVDRGSLFTVLLAAMLGWEALRRNRAGEAGQCWQPLKALVVIVVVSVLIAAPMMASTWKLSGSDSILGDSDDPASRYAWATTYSFPPEEVITYVVPGFMGWATAHPGGPYWGRIGRVDSLQSGQEIPNFSLGTAVIGTIPFAFAMLGFFLLWLRRDRNGNAAMRRDLDVADPRAVHLAWFFAVAAIVTLLLSMGKYTPLHGLYYQLPYQENWRNPIKFLAPFNFCVVFVAAIGLQWVAALIARRNALPLPAPESDPGEMLREHNQRMHEQDEAKAAPGTAAPKRRELEPDSRDSEVIAAIKSYFLEAQPVMRFAMGLTGALVALFVAFLLPGSVALSGLLGAEGYSPEAIVAALANVRATLLMAGVQAAVMLSALHIGLYPERWRGLEITNPSIRQGLEWSLAPANRVAACLMLAGVAGMFQMAWVLQQNIQGSTWKELVDTNGMVELSKKDPVVHRVAILGGDNMGLRTDLLNYMFPSHGVATADTAAVSRTPRDYAAYNEAIKENPVRHYFLAGVKYVFGQREALDALMGSDMFQQQNKIVGSPYTFGLPQGPGLNPLLYHAVALEDFMAKVTLVPGIEVYEQEPVLLARLVDARWNPRSTALMLNREAARLPQEMLQSMRRVPVLIPGQTPPPPPSIAMPRGTKPKAAPTAPATGAPTPATAPEIPGATNPGATNATDTSVPQAEKPAESPAAPAATNEPIAPHAETNGAPVPDLSSTNAPAQGGGGGHGESNDFSPTVPASAPTTLPRPAATPGSLLPAPPPPPPASAAPAGTNAPSPGTGSLTATGATNAPAPPADTTPRLGDRTGAGKAKLLRFDQHVTAFEAETTAPTLAVVNDHFEDEWKATVNGQPVTIVRVNAIMIGIPLPAGKATVELRYAPNATPVWLGLGAWMALLAGGAAVLLAAGLRPYRSAPSGPGAASESVASGTLAASSKVAKKQKRR
ncbi:hypothetical protein DB346_14655 [Verrucomicrobia bacterium LW23]|nr:hypothetical protein DB346_14655 [Verrucomicrobia bacterium LW23]